MARGNQLMLTLGLALLSLVLTTGYALRPNGAATPRTPEDLVYVIPSGGAAAEMRGEPVVAIPNEIHVTAGQSITVRNEDQAMHYFFFAPIAPGQSFRKTFSQPGSFGYSGVLSCSIGRLTSLTVFVAEPVLSP